ncbi:glycosyltransferase family 2 protein [Candidatus Saccharibacteria bacterium]|nr:glycosyltransferase family 2 protein [Candidatus Saccharibacteria bacterium]
MLSTILLATLTFSMIIAIFIFCRVINSRIRYRTHPITHEDLPLDQIPSITVAIPARNETHAMTRCLESIIASDYPKLEILIIDDASVDNTSVLIKSFAHAGVRFIKGPPLPPGWMGRNFAYQVLSRAATGRYIFFMSVDTHITPTTITQLVDQLQQRNSEMISVLPVRLDAPRFSVFFSTLRFFNELIFHDFKTHPPVTSGAWLVNRELLSRYAGNLSNYSDDVQIESKIGQIFASHKQYSFILSSFASGVSYEKHWLSQVETSIRIYALSYRGAPIRQLIRFLVLLSFLAPPITLAYSIFSLSFLILFLAVLSQTLLSVSFFLYARLAWSRGSILALFLFPFIAIQEFIIFIVATYKRHFGRITWKGRHVYSSKPSIRQN